MEASIYHEPVNAYAEVRVCTGRDLGLTPPKMTIYFRFADIYDSSDRLEFFEKLAELRDCGATAVGISRRSRKDFAASDFNDLAGRTDYMIFCDAYVRVHPWEVKDRRNPLSVGAAIARMKAKYPQFKAGAKAEVFVFGSAIIDGTMQTAPPEFGRPSAHLNMCITHLITGTIGWMYDGEGQAEEVDDDAEWIELEDAKALEAEVIALK